MRISAVIVMSMLLITALGCIEKAPSHEESSTGILFVGAYLNYTIESPLETTGYLYIKILDENETHYKVYRESVLRSKGVTSSTSSTRWEPKEKVLKWFVSWEPAGKARIYVHGKELLCSKYVNSSNGFEYVFYVYEEVPIRVEFTQKVDDRTVTIVYVLNSTNVIKLS